MANSYDKGFITIDRKILNWEWYQNANTFRVFFHLVAIANYSDVKKNGVVIPRGSVDITQKQLAEKLKLTRDQVRKAIEHLKRTHEITQENPKGLGGKYSIYTIVNYDKYQLNPQRNTQRNTQRNPIESPLNPHLINKDNKDNKENNNSVSANGIDGLGEYGGLIR